MSAWQYPYAQAGDLIFVRKMRKHIPIETAGRLTKRPFPDFIHVATVVAPADIVEATFRKVAYTTRLGEWHSAGGDKNSYVALRHPQAAHRDDMQALVDAAIYFLDEEYALPDVIRDVVSPQPVTVGRSICSVLATKILMRAGLINEKAVNLERQIYPGELFQCLTLVGWQEKQLDGTKYFEGMATKLGYSPMQVYRSTRVGLGSFHDILSSVENLGRAVREQLRAMPDADLIFSLAMNPDTSVFEYVRDAFNHATILRVKVAQILVSVPENWKEEVSHGNDVPELMADADALVDNALSLLHRFQGELSKIAQSSDADFQGELGDASGYPDEAKISAHLKASLDLQCQMEIGFFNLTGMTADEFLGEWKEVTLPPARGWPIISDEQLDDLKASQLEIWDILNEALLGGQEHTDRIARFVVSMREHLVKIFGSDGMSDLNAIFEGFVANSRESFGFLRASENET